MKKRRRRSKNKSHQNEGVLAHYRYLFFKLALLAMYGFILYKACDARVHTLAGKQLPIGPDDLEFLFGENATQLSKEQGGGKPAGYSIIRTDRGLKVGPDCRVIAVLESWRGLLPVLTLSAPHENQCLTLLKGLFQALSLRVISEYQLNHAALQVHKLNKLNLTAHSHYALSNPPLVAASILEHFFSGFVFTNNITVDAEIGVFLHQLSKKFLYIDDKHQYQAEVVMCTDVELLQWIKERAHLQGRLMTHAFYGTVGLQLLYGALAVIPFWVEYCQRYCKKSEEEAVASGPKCS